MTPCWKYCSQTTATTTSTMTTTMTTTATTTTTGGNKQVVETPFEKGEKKNFCIKRCFLLLVSFEGKKEKGLKTETTV